MPHDASRPKPVSAGAREPASEADIRKMAELLFAQVDPEDAAAIDAAARLKLGEAALRTLGKHRPGRPKLRVEPLAGRT
ncbi:MAG: hypothetical protein LDL25_10015, partial [Hyphomicrobiales bacterium]|nr:hypothetical protein [Hyphomicrobiales bacterium]